ncbi:MAG: hypothetical protein U1E12_19555 [Hydrogenophaga sp.]|uniref:hypothetical protein n=1 Tax=Hydrogenophaga sp. TaxID=1904254 RepID=UPI002AB8D04F|nr:hypothetical protein [Hydrogenophaga sp.]MDZ4103870.1 hypothetical protein [Hydrogenophaga sp.]
MKTRYFVFVEFTDPRVRQFLDDLRNALNGCSLHDTPHITVRGPYTAKPEAASLEKWRQGLSGHGVLLIDIGLFKTPKGFAVFLHAKSKIFDDIWYKPDYQGPKSSRKPHVTLFESKSLYAAQSIRDFLLSENLSVFTLGVDLTVYTTKQHELLGYNYGSLDPTYSQSPPERIVFRDGIFERAQKLQEFIAEQENGSSPQANLF